MANGSKNNKGKAFTCSHGKGKVDGTKCSVRRKRNMCPNGHPCKRV
ncbi:hypothetical protein K9M48_04755 [Candidatus Gracilibacteria bacterium]|nr:hypothetical protein [Candidatus Gracilibacteria bacterium]